MKSSLDRGTHVIHRLFGLGTIQDEWGSWYSCRSCYVELRPNQLQCDECAARAALFPYSEEPLYPLQVSGKGTYEILFKDGKVRAINQCWLSVEHGPIDQKRNIALAVFDSQSAQASHNITVRKVE